VSLELGAIPPEWERYLEYCRQPAVEH